jgi:hypothetical protein
VGEGIYFSWSFRFHIPGAFNVSFFSNVAKRGRLCPKVDSNIQFSDYLVLMHRLLVYELKNDHVSVLVSLV